MNHPIKWQVVPSLGMEKASLQGYYDNMGYVVVNATTGTLLPTIDLMSSEFDGTDIRNASQKMQSLRILYTS